MKRFFSRWLLALALVPFAAGCSEDPTEDAPQEIAKPTIKVEGIPAEGMHFLYSDTDTRSFVLTVDAPWEITKDAGWFVVSPRTGKAGEFTVEILPEYNENPERSGSITITANSGDNINRVTETFTFDLAQDAFLAAGIKIEGIEENIALTAEETAPITASVTATYDWTLTVSDDSWLSVSPRQGSAGQTTAVTIIPKANTEPLPNESVLTFAAFDPTNPVNSVEKVITLTQAGFSLEDSHEVGYKFFSEDFDWITPLWPVATQGGYGWPTVNTNPERTNPSNEFAFSNVSSYAPVSYTVNSYVYARYEGYVKFGNSGNMGSLTTSKLSEIDANTTARLLVSFWSALYYTYNENGDKGDTNMHITVIGNGTINGLTETEASFDLAADPAKSFSWTKYQFIVEGADSDTQIMFGANKAVSSGRMYIDNIEITRAGESTVADEPELIVSPVDKSVTYDVSALLEGQMLKAEGGTIPFSVRINRAWSVEVESDGGWLTIGTVQCGGAANGATVAADKLSATVRGTGLPYNTSSLVVAENMTTMPRLGKILIKVDGEVLEEIQVGQNGRSAAAPTITIEGLDNGAVPDFAADAAESKTIDITSNYDWTIEIPASDTWYTVTPLSGKANEKTTVTVATTGGNTGAALAGAFTVKYGDKSESVAVAQRAAEGIVSGLPAQWNFSASTVFSMTQNTIASDTGNGTFSFVFVNTNDPNNKHLLDMAKNSPRATGVWPGDYWLFSVDVENIPADTKIEFKAASRVSGTGHKYWLLEYYEGGEWKPALDLQTAAEAELGGVQYTHAMLSDGNTNIPVEATITLTEGIAKGQLQIRFRCVANWQASGAGPLANPNGGTARISSSSDAGISPTIKIVE